GAGGDGVAGGAEVVEGAAVALLGDAGAAGVAVVDEDRGRPGIGMPGGGEAADVPAVAHGEQGEQPDLGVLGGVGGAGDVPGVEGGGVQQAGREGVPVGDGLEPGRGQVEVLVAEQLARADPAALVADDLLGDVDPAQPEGGAGELDLPGRLDHGHVDVAPGLGVLVALGLGHQGDTVVEVQLGHPEVLALVEVDGPAVDRRRRPCPVDGADDLAGVGGHDGDRAAAGVADVDLVGLAAAPPGPQAVPARPPGPLGPG